MVQVVKNNQQLTEGLAYQQELLRIQVVRSQSEVQALTQMVIEVADGGSGVVGVRQFLKPHVLHTC